MCIYIIVRLHIHDFFIYPNDPSQLGIWFIEQLCSFKNLFWIIDTYVYMIRVLLLQ